MRALIALLMVPLMLLNLLGGIVSGIRLATLRRRSVRLAWIGVREG